jgi:hypothetical protein
VPAKTITHHAFNAGMLKSSASSTRSAGGLGAGTDATHRVGVLASYRSP